MKLAITIGLGLALALATKTALAQTTITSFPGNGQLTWTNSPGTNGFAVQWAPTVAGPWSSSWQSLDSLITTGTQTTVSVPMFYRVSQGFTPAALRGPWLLNKGTNDYAYAMFDGAGTVTEVAFFYPGIPCGYYSVQPTGTVAITFLTTHDGPRPVQGSFVSGQQIVLDPATDNFQMFQVLVPSKCQGHWTGALQATNGSSTLTAVSFDVDASGLISNFTGLPTFVVGRMLSDSANRTSAFFRNGAAETNPYNQVQVSGTLSGNTVSGVFYVDAGGNSPAGTLNLQRQ